MSKKKQNMNQAQLGHDFEDCVRKIYETNGYALVKMNKVFRNYNSRRDGATKREYDLEMFNRKNKQFYIIECKSHFSSSKYVPLGQVKEFHRKLINYNGKNAKAVMVTDTDFTIPAQRYAKKNNIEMVNGKKLRKMKRNVTNITGVIKSVESKMVSAVFGGLESCVKKLVKEYLK